MAHSFYQNQPRPTLPPIPPQLKNSHRPPLPPVPHNYRTQAAAEQRYQVPAPISTPFSLTADNLRQIDCFNHPPPPQPLRSHSALPPRSSPAPGYPPATAPLARAHSHQNQSHALPFLEPSPRLANFPPNHRQHSQPASPGLLSPSSKPIALPVLDLDMLTTLYELHFRSQNDPAGQVQWAAKLLKFLERSQAAEPASASAPGSPSSSASSSSSSRGGKARPSTKISDPLLVKYTDIALTTVLKHADGPNPHLANGGAEAVYLRGDLFATGAFPSYQPKDPMLAFRDFENAAQLGYYLAWFRIGREYENCEDWDRAVGAYEHGLAFEECACVYRLGMSYLLGQMNLPVDMAQAVVYLKKAAQLASEETPQPAYIYGMILAGEFESLPQIPHEILPPNLGEARYMIEKAAYLGFAAAQYKIGWCYEYSQITCPFDPLLSVEYYSLASQQGESEADMALSKWFLCGADGYFAANEPLAVTFAEKAARKGLGSAMFAIGYYLEVGIAGRQDGGLALEWYERAWEEGGNEDARERLASLGAGGHMLSREQHEDHVDEKLTMRRVEIARRAAEAPPALQASRTHSPPSPPLSIPTTPGSAYSPSPSRPHLNNHSSSGHIINRLNSFQLSDNPPSPIPLEPAPPAAPKTQFNSFADMGIQTAKAKKTEECLIV
ncbi:hypothetical protein PtB15_2B683 [Puccinia triticina]|nr:hypothetical protein PtB15_2B683 [Puccinia triticina]